MNVEFADASAIVIGSHTVINQRVYLDGRGGLVIGDNVNISSHVLLVAGTHDVQDGAAFRGEARRIVIEDYAWICTRAIILPGVTVGRGAVVAAGAVVTKSVTPHAIVAGVPARTIGQRTADLSYQLSYPRSWV
jgi:maltose O-acetyltransferase